MATGQIRRPISGGTFGGVRPERYDYWRVGHGERELFNLSFWLERAGEFHCRPNFTTGDFHWPYTTQLYYHLAGNATFSAPGHGFTASPGDLMIIPPYQPFSYHGVADVRFYWLSVDGEWPSILGASPHLRQLRLGRDPIIEDYFVELREALLLRKRGYPIKAVGVFYELIARVEALNSEPPEESIYPEAVRNAMIYLAENFDRTFDASRTAAAVNLSQSHLRALFEKWLGESPRQFHTRCRIDQAKRLLNEQDLSISEVATQVGYTDLRHFSRVFKRVTGIAPSHYDRLLS